MHFAEGNNNCPPPVGYFSSPVFYGVTGGLSGAIVVCIVIIILLAFKAFSGGTKDVEKNELLDSSRETTVSNSGCFTRNRTYTFKGGRYFRLSPPCVHLVTFSCQ